MHEELSRLLAGELEPEAEAALRARIATEPPLAQAWKRMSALPGLLSALPAQAPPTGLMAKLYAMVPDDSPAERALDAALAELAARPLDAGALASLEADLLDAAPFAPDPREDTIDPEPRAPVHAGAPVRLAATRHADRGAERRLERSPARNGATTGVATGVYTRRGPVLLGLVATLALAVGGAALLPAPAEPPTLALSSGESVVEGEVHVRAGDLDLRVDGRVRISVTPPAERVLTDIRGAELIYVPSAAPVADRARDRAAAASAPGLVVATSGRSEVESDTLDDPRTLALVGGSARAQGGGVVTVRVERGDAVVSSGGREMRVVAGEERTFDLGGAPRVPAPFQPDRGTIVDEAPMQPPTHVDEAVARRDLPFTIATTLTTVAAALDNTPTAWPSQLDASWSADEVEALLIDVADAVPGADLVDLDCDEYPCLAVYAAATPDGAWMRDVTEAVRDLVPDRAFVETAAGPEGELLAVAVGPSDATPSLTRLDARMEARFRDLRRERGF